MVHNFLSVFIFLIHFGHLLTFFIILHYSILQYVVHLGSVIFCYILDFIFLGISYKILQHFIACDKIKRVL